MGQRGGFPPFGSLGGWKSISLTFLFFVALRFRFFFGRFGHLVILSYPSKLTLARIALKSNLTVSRAGDSRQLDTLGTLRSHSPLSCPWEVEYPSASPFWSLYHFASDFASSL